mmetsp:Transcript_13144/g.11228  ORF Transcript_13144/g.11228 Transcript_13144/m.11228 type:complete len:82 (-) Transcript_13144:477-722(-)
MKSVRVLMNLLDSIDLEIAQNAAKILLNITDNEKVKEDLRLEGGIEKLLGTLNFADEDLIILVQKVLNNMAGDENCALLLT